MYKVKCKDGSLHNQYQTLAVAIFWKGEFNEVKPECSPHTIKKEPDAE